MATATRGVVDDAVEMTPKGMFASEKCDPRGMLNHERRDVMLNDVPVVLLLVLCSGPAIAGLDENRGVQSSRERGGVMLFCCDESAQCLVQFRADALRISTDSGNAFRARRGPPCCACRDVTATDGGDDDGERECGRIP
jgi:hypothetical protein